MREFEIAERIETRDWEDRILDAQAREAVEDIMTWEKHAEPLRGWHVLLQDVGDDARMVLAAMLAGASLPGWRIDLERLAARVEDATEALGALFDGADRREWALFLDNADALIAAWQDGSDRAANQKTAYLLQRIEDCTGLVILATTIRSHLDDAFARRFQSVLFPRSRDQGRT